MCCLYCTTSIMYFVILFAILMLPTFFLDIKFSGFIETLNCWMLRLLKTIGQLSSQHFEIEEIAIVLNNWFPWTFQQNILIFRCFTFVGGNPDIWRFLTSILLCKYKHNRIVHEAMPIFVRSPRIKVTTSISVTSELNKKRSYRI